MAAAAAGGGGGGGGGGDGDSNGRAVKPHELKVKKQNPQPRDRAESGSPESAVTTCTATPAALNGGGGDDDDGVEVTQQTNGKRARTPAASNGGGVALVQQQTNGKRPRLVWTTELHERFVRACRSLGREVVPKKILEAMKVNGLTRENVASHLQKYRQNLRGRRQQATRRRGTTSGGDGTVTMQHVPAPSLQQPAFPQAQAQPPIEAAFRQAPPTPPQGPFAAANMPQPQQMLVQALPALVRHHHQPRPDFPMLVPQQLFYQPPQFHQAAMQQRHRILMEQQARRAARMNVQGRGHHQVAARNYELGAQAPAIAPAAAALAFGVQSHLMEPYIQASQAVSMNGGLCLVPEASTRDEQTPVGMAQMQVAVEAEGRQVPAAEPAFAGSADPDGGQHEDSCDVLHFWNTGSAPSMDNEFPPNKPI